MRTLLYENQARYYWQLTETITSVPCPGWLFTVSCALMRSARSLIPNKPKPLLKQILSVSKPCPLSCTRKINLEVSYTNSIFIAVALAYLKAFVNASCPLRNRLFSASNGREYDLPTTSKIVRVSASDDICLAI